MLWLAGPPGVGKSVLTRYFLERVLAGSDMVSLAEDYSAISFFCSYSEAVFNSETVILRSILHQLIRIYPQSQNIVRNRLQIRTRWGLEYRFEPDYLWGAIEEVLALNPMRRCLIVVDAIEELPPDATRNVLAEFYKLITIFRRTKVQHQLRVFISSRFHPDYNNVLLSVFTIRVQSLHVNRDIEAFVRDSISEFAQSNSAFGEIADASIQRKITSEISKRAEGIFLWAAITVEDFRRGLLWNCDVLEEKLRQLDSAPSGLNMLYDRMMDKVDISIRKDMWSIFSVLAVAARPLREIELEVILAINYSEHNFTTSTDIQPFRNLNDIIESNFPELVKIDDNGCLNFTHLSFREYIHQHLNNKDPLWLEKTRRAVTRACLIYLNLKDLIRDAKIHQRSIHRSMSGKLQSPTAD